MLQGNRLKSSLQDTTVMKPKNRATRYNEMIKHDLFLAKYRKSPRREYITVQKYTGCQIRTLSNTFVSPKHRFLGLFFPVRRKKTPDRRFNLSRMQIHP